MAENMEALPEEVLIQRAQAQDYDAMDALMQRYKGIVRKRARSLFIIGGDQDDLMQEGMIGLFKAIQDYDKSKEAVFSTFAELCISRQLYNAVEASNRKKHAPLNSYVSFYAGSEEEGQSLLDSLSSGEIGNPEDMIISQENAKQFWKQLRERLSGMEQQVLDEYLSGLNYKQIAQRMGKSPKAIDNALQRIKGKIC